MNLRNKLTLANANPNESTPLSRAIFFIIIGVAFYLLDRFSFFAVDDYMYAYKYSSFDRIDNLRDIIMSQCEHYMNHNGRFVVHCVVQIFCGILGISAFQYINTLFFIGFCGITTRLVFNTWNVSIVKYSLVAFVVFFLGPRIEYNILGSVAYCINYLWVSVLIGLFLILFHKTATNSEAKSLSYFHKSLIFVYSVLVGSLQESFSVPLCCSLLISHYYTNNTQTIKSFVPCREGELLSFLQNNKNISENVWYMPEYDCYVIEYDDNKHSNIMVSYEITGLNALLKRIKGEDIVVQSVLTEAQKNYYIKHNSLVYIFLFRTLEGPIQRVWLK